MIFSQNLSEIMGNSQSVNLYTEGLEKKQGMYQECYNLLYTLDNGTLVCAIHKHVAMSYRHGRNQNLKKGQPVTLTQHTTQKTVKANVVDFSNETDFVYFITNEDLVEKSPKHIIPHAGMPYNVISLYKDSMGTTNAAVSSYGNIYTDQPNSNGHYRGTTAPLYGESGALVVDDFGSIIGISVGGCNRWNCTDQNGFTNKYLFDNLIYFSRVASHRLIVPVYVLKGFLAINYPEKEEAFFVEE